MNIEYKKLQYLRKFNVTLKLVFVITMTQCIKIEQCRSDHGENYYKHLLFFKVDICGKTTLGTLLSNFKPTINMEQKISKFIRIGIYSKFFYAIYIVALNLPISCYNSFVQLDHRYVSKLSISIERCGNPYCKVNKTQK